jgi:hypothetical protein
MAMSLSIAPIKTKKSRQKSITELFADVRRKLTSDKPVLSDLQLQEYISRGWNQTNKTRRGVLWTSLDEDFRAAELEKPQTTPVWKLGWNPRKQEENDSDESELLENDVAYPDPGETAATEERELGVKIAAGSAAGSGEIATEKGKSPKLEAEIVEDAVPDLQL